MKGEKNKKVKERVRENREKDKYRKLDESERGGVMEGGGNERERKTDKAKEKERKKKKGRENERKKIEREKEGKLKDKTKEKLKDKKKEKKGERTIWQI